MSLLINKFAPRLLTQKQIISLRNRGAVNQAERLSMCKACGHPILIGEMRITGGVGYLNGLTVHIHQKCEAA